MKQSYLISSSCLLLLSTLSLTSCTLYPTPAPGTYQTSNTSVNSALTGYYYNQPQKILASLNQLGAKAFKRGNTVIILLPNDVLFELGTPTLTDNSYTLLDKVVTLLMHYPSHSIHITGNTDNVADQADNLLLSQQQAKSVSNYLWVHGVPAQNMLIAGKGDRDPLASNSYSIGSAANRRIEIIFNTEALK